MLLCSPQDANIETVYDGSSVYGLSKPTGFAATTWSVVRHNLGFLCGGDVPRAARGFTIRGLKYSRWLELQLANVIPGGAAALNSLVVTGHSLGGAAASAFAYWFAAKYPTVRLDVYVFEAPCLGNETFLAEYMDRVPRTFAHVFDWDLVPQVAPQNMACNRYRVLFTLKDRCRVLGCNPLNWIIKLHLDSEKVFVPWIQAAYPGAYEKMWAEHAERTTCFWGGKLVRVADNCAKIAPGAEGLLSTSDFAVSWLDQGVCSLPCIVRWLRVIGDLTMTLGLYLIFGTLIALLISAPCRSFGMTIATAFLSMVEDEVFRTKLGEVALAVMAIISTALGWLASRSAYNTLGNPGLMVKTNIDAPLEA